MTMIDAPDAAITATTTASLPAVAEVAITSNPMVAPLPAGDDAAVTNSAPGSQEAVEKRPQDFNRDWRFWAIMATLSLGILLVSLEGTVPITSLPTIDAELHIGKNYIWVTNSFLLTSAAVIPLFGQLCNVFGRRSVLVFIFAAYTLGSGICGGANGGAMLIAGRTVQGIGSGGLNAAADVIIGDLVPLRYRGNYIALLLIVATVGYAIGPIVGGLIVQGTSWRWVFYLNLPISGLGMVAAYFFLNLQYDRDEPIMKKLARIDYVGNAIMIASTISILIALTWAGPSYPWSDAHILVPLLVGLAGLVAFMVYEASGLAVEAVVPVRLFPNWTSRIIYINTFINNVLIFWCFFYFPLYFQGVLLSTPARSGVQLLPITLIAVPGAAASAIALTRFGRYKLLHLVGFVMLTVGVVTISQLGRDSPTAFWVGIQIVPAIGSGFLLNTMLPAFQASTLERDQAAATSAWAFSRAFGLVWGIAVAGAVFNTYTKQYAYMVDDPAVRELLSDGSAYSSATRDFLLQIPEPIRGQVQEVFMLALRKVFIISAAFGGFCILTTIFEKDIPLRVELDTQYGLEEREKQSKAVLETAEGS